MNNFIKQIIEEKFASKAQQRYFYAQAGKGGKKGKKWAKWAKEFSADTDFEKIPDKVEKEVDEIVDEKGNIKRGKKSTDFNKKGITQRKTTDDVIKTGAGSMGIHGVHGTHTSLRYWAESDMSKALGYEDTMGSDEDMEDAEQHFQKELGMSDEETKKRLDQMGYDEELPDDKVRLVENPKKFAEEYLESVLNKRSKENDLVKKEDENLEVKEISPIIKRQINSLKNSMKSHNLTLNDISKHLKDNDE
jgi:hypothetical protein